MNLFKSIVSSLIFTLILLMPTISQASDPAGGYQLDLKVIMNDGRIFQPSVVLASGKEGQITLFPENSDLSSLQIRVQANPRNEETLTIKAQVLELTDRKWSIINEAALAGYFSKKMAFDLGIDGYIEVIAKQVVIDNALSKSLSIVADCNKNISPMGGGAIGIGDGNSNCCSSSCTDGSGLTLKCCNVVSCSGCGTSCSP